MVRFSIKIHKIHNEIMLAACDMDVLGQEYEEGEYRLFVSKDFYHERFVEETVFKELLSQSTIINLVGENVINIALKEGFIDCEHIFRVAKIPHAQSLRMIIH